jgi:HSP20 family protein
LEPFSFGENSWGPALEIGEHDDKYTIKAELPGMKQEEIEVSVLDHTLSIKGEKKHKEEVKKNGYHYSEVSYGTFYRSVTLPADVTTDKIEANYEDGVLVVNVPRTPEAKPKKVTVQSKKKEQKAKAK